MKVRNLMMTAIFLVAVGGSFALKATTNPPIIASFQFNANGTILCLNGSPVQPECGTTWTGPACTAFYMGTYHNSFVGVNGGPNACKLPLFQPF